nr:nuclear envelope pore membrane protein POM 121-like [Aegilops tauschii subsp. strangulata]
MPPNGRVGRRTLVVGLAIFITTVAASLSSLRLRPRARHQHDAGAAARDGASSPSASAPSTFAMLVETAHHGTGPVALRLLCPAAAHPAASLLHSSDELAGFAELTPSSPLRAPAPLRRCAASLSGRPARVHDPDRARGRLPARAGCWLRPVASRPRPGSGSDPAGSRSSASSTASDPPPPPARAPGRLAGPASSATGLLRSAPARGFACTLVRRLPDLQLQGRLPPSPHPAGYSAGSSAVAGYAPPPAAVPAAHAGTEKKEREEESDLKVKGQVPKKEREHRGWKEGNVGC